ncbi:hypothetical protein [Mycobacteroides abscessus]|uniref:hypothetical protein n=1 Tax=Mycobacteroides abscessus TaxID=36809 RepID=UPI0009285888|nr:hypothetical protein [Mycobacteroides abscessus]SHV73301.1 Uncharacterised protein [Mycobacteroides abscessus subsp. abscessus]SHW31960.1 Uncharacterised protein [Mycobacteroides abscessus subsp. abscessus]SHW40256.1 Uncharacterised protein [Mycobacteroides abscessus subsp. abscessus]SHW67231.1 Uncharacterised protein [Mycobacteroides abscessus subsp. abscessus]SHX17699.1 Uncharacterised protein [Mycobacteroides abscessus subsp. abscessus]
MNDLSQSAPLDGPLHLMLISAAFEEVARTASTWAPDEAETACRFFSGMSELVELALLDPTRVSTAAAIEAVSFMAQAYAKAADQIRRADIGPELGAAMKRSGNAQAAEWLQVQGDRFDSMAAKLNELMVR